LASDYETWGSVIRKLGIQLDWARSAGLLLLATWAQDGYCGQRL